MVEVSEVWPVLGVRVVRCRLSETEPAGRHLLRPGGRAFVLANLFVIADFIKAEQAAEADALQADATLHAEVAAAKRWARDTGRTARSRRG